MRMFVILIVMVTLYGCAASQPNIKIKLQTSFDLERTRRAMVDGSNTIEGSALMRQVNGGVVTCAGQEVVATPVTTCSTERIRYLYGNDTAEFRDMNSAISNPNPFEETPNEYVTNQRRTVCDAQGFFWFEKLADGNFFVVSEIQWKSDPRSLFFEGGFMMRKVSVSGGELKEIVLSR